MGNNPIIWSFWGHEPLRHLRRMGNDGASVFSLGEWVDDWYQHIHSEELVKRASEVGINVIYTHFFKGFGLNAEHDEMQNTKKLCKIAGKYGIKVLGYCQLGSLYTEVLKAEIPELESMAIKNSDGTLACWLKQYYRLRPCFNSCEFIAYIKKVIDYGINEIGLNGFHFDNSYNIPCYCDKCTKAFREYLTENVSDPLKTMGLDNFNYVQIPQVDTSFETHDVLYMYYLRYKVDLCAKVQHEIFSYAKDAGAEIVLHNPVFPKGGEYFTERGFEPSKLTKSCDFVFAENPDYIRFEDGKIITQAEAFKYGELFGYKVFDTCWHYDENNLATLSDKYSDTSRFLAQSMIFGGVCGSPQTIRSLKDGHKNMLEDSNLYDVLKHMYSYYKENINIFSAKAHNYVKILYSPLSMMFARDYGMKTFSECVNEAIRASVPFSFVTENDLDGLESSQTLILPSITYADDSLVQKVLSASARGVKVLQVGKFATYNEDGKERAASHEIVNNNFIKAGKSLRESIRALNIEHEISCSASDVIVETKKLDNGNLVIHLLCTDNEEAKDVYIDIAGVSLDKFTYISSENAVAERISGNRVKISGIRTTVSLIISK